MLIVSTLRGVLIPLGFIFDGALLGFILARFQFLNIDGIFCSGSANGALPGECYFYTGFTRYRVGIILHLATILPAGLLAVLQFTPIIRHKAILYHRIAGYVAILLVVVSIFGAFVIADTSFGGDMTTRTFVGFLGLISIIGLGMAWWNIRCKQIDQHRAWMLRSWFWMGSIITLRIIMIIAAQIISLPGILSSRPLSADFPCPQLGWMQQQYNSTGLSGDEQLAALGALYPSCAGHENDMLTVAPVTANFNGAGAIDVAAAFHVNFGTAGVLALILHAIGVEIYLKLTPRESERLRAVSYQKQLEAGFKNPGSAGLVIEKFGDADPWVPPEQRSVPGKMGSRDESESPLRVPAAGK